MHDLALAWMHIYPYYICRSCTSHNSRLLSIVLDRDLCHARKFVTSDSATGGLTKCTAVLVYHPPDDQFFTSSR